MAWVDTFLFRGLIRHNVRDELVAGQAKRNGLFRSTPDSATETLRVEPKRGFYVVNRKSEMENNLCHRMILRI